ncbi:Carcinoembryonic antigen-related cell adhesion molecule 5 [Podarcis lilfordi]|uniref:Carcinoembryonic antigen-related cell adhesion molecule 5 n=2 Tax=Podarcis lilfordi TaxID=74358 RepID=A0AA35KML2_9SAUR|nr:Carcinoembryonic antigen-related cell adhesion molecule 5 [Podarcis lilfordi]
MQRAHPVAGAPSGRGRPWPMLLLAAHILNSCFALVQAENIRIPIVLDPWRPSLGNDVTLVPVSSMERVSFCGWFRGKISEASNIVTYQPQPVSIFNISWAYTGRVDINPHCSLHITNLTLLDSGYYMLQKKKVLPDSSEVGRIYLAVKDLGGKKKVHILPAKVTAGLVVGCISLSLFLVGVTSYYTLSNYARIDPEQAHSILI